MNGLILRLSTNKTNLIACINPKLIGASFDVAIFTDFVKQSEFSQCFLSDEKISALAETVNNDIEIGSSEQIEMPIGEVKDGKVSVAIANDKMSATLTITSHYYGKVPNASMISFTIKQQGIVRGVSQKRIKALIKLAEEGLPGTEHSDVIAKGLGPRKGKDSYIKPLVSNSFERILAPQNAGNDKIDMRNFGDILCVKPGQSVAVRVPPGKGRSGYTVTNRRIKSSAGDLKDIKLGDNTAISSTDENTIIATLAGQTKFEDGRMSIDDTFVTKGVNVGTGNIIYDGAVIVNGDITENMQIEAKGDVTVNGFVESALIQAGGDIIITQGAMGKVQEEDCRLIAKGNVFVQNGQGLNIVAGIDINIAKQLAYSRIKCGGNLTVGAPNNPMGNLFASHVNCQKAVFAGSVGAISGSELIIDFSDGYNALIKRTESLAELFKTLTSNNADNEIRISSLNNKKIPEALTHKMAQLNDELESERILLNWLRETLADLQQRKVDYESNAGVYANKELFMGVTIKLNKKIWKAEEEYAKCRISLKEGNWTYNPV